jgi:ketosteroid isomerase-like protein
LPIVSNAEIVERILDAWRNLESIPQDLMDPKIEWVNPPDAVEPGTRQGKEGFEGAESAVGRAYSAIGFDVQRQVEAGDTVGLVVETLYRGRGSGVEVREPLGMTFRIREGRVVRFEWSRQPEELLERVVGA